MSSLSTSLKNSYAKWLEPYELWLRGAKPGVQMQLEQERGGPFGTPSPGPSPMRKSNQHTPSNLRDSPAVRASTALNASLDGYGTPPPPSIPQSSIPPRPSGFTAVNTGGFKAVNASLASFTAVDTPPSVPREIERKPDLIVPHASSPNPSCASGTPLNGLSSFESKRKLSEGIDDDVDANSESAGRRSKRVKKGKIYIVTTGNQTEYPQLICPRWTSNGNRFSMLPGSTSFTASRPR